MACLKLQYWQSPLVILQLILLRKYIKSVPPSAAMEMRPPNKIEGKAVKLKLDRRTPDFERLKQTLKPLKTGVE